MNRIRALKVAGWLAVMIACALVGAPSEWAQSGHSAAPGPADAARADIDQFPHCPICGMDRAKFAYSRFLVTYDEGTVYGTCSIHCAAVDLAVKLGVAPKSIEVGDYSNGKLIDAQKASWVIGGSQPGVMTRRAKWAFETPELAREFIAQHGGNLVDFETVIKAAYEDMYEDTRMIRQKRRQMKHKNHGG
jgi:copper chaperone NosL